MTCDTVLEQLDALSDGELRPWTARRLRRHIAHCSTCAAELAAIHRLAGRVDAWHDVPAPGGLREKLPTPARLRRLRLAWRPTLAVVGAAAAVTAVALFTPGQPAHPTVTFADVQSALQQINVVSYDSTFEEHYTSGFQLRLISHHWFRRNPPAIASVSRPDECLPPGNTQPMILQDARGITTYYVPGTYSSMSIPYSVDKRPGAILTPGKIQRLWPMLAGPINSRNLVPTAAGAIVTSTQSGSETLAGSVVLTFVRRYHYQNGSDVSQCVQTVSVDPKTLHTLQVETTTRTGAFLTTEVAANFRYNATAPPGTFDWSPPKGFHVEVRR